LKVTNLNEIAQTLAALEASQFLIVISSPNAAQSKYVSEETASRCWAAPHIQDIVALRYFKPA
jgi:hypothetical protein